LEKTAQTFKDGRYLEAVRLCRQTQETGGAQTASEKAQLQFELGRALSRTGPLDEAEACLLKAQTLTAAEYGENSLPYSALLNELGLLKYFKQQMPEAAALLKRSLAIRKDLTDGPTLEVSDSLANLDWTHARLSDLSQAMRCADHALAIRKQIVGEEHEDYGEALGAKAYVTGLQGDWAESEQLQRRALSIMESRLRPDHANLAVSLNNLVYALLSQEKSDQAEQLCLRAIEIRKKACCTGSHLTAICIANLGSVYLHQGNTEKALQQFEQAALMAERALGKDSPEMSHHLLPLAHIYKLVKHPDAENLQKRVEHLLSKSSSAATEIESIIRLSYDLHAQNKFEQADAACLRACQIAEQIFGSGSLKEAEIRECQGVWNLFTNPQRAGECFTTVLRIRKKHLGNCHPDVARTLVQLSRCLAVQGDRDTSQLLLAQANAISFKTGSEMAPQDEMMGALERVREALGGRDPDVIKQMRSTADVLRDAGKIAESDALYEDYWTAREQQLGGTSHALADELIVTGLMRLHAGEHNSAADLLKRGLGIKQGIFGPSHEELLIPLEGLSAAARAIKDYQLAEECIKQSIDIFQNAYGQQTWLLINPLCRLIILHELQNKTAAVSDIEKRIRQMPRPSSLDSNQYSEDALRMLNKLGNQLHSQARLAFVVSQALWTVRELDELSRIHQRLHLGDQSAAVEAAPRD
jgi:tetratricopeptide (TPR) repeat protein